MATLMIRSMDERVKSELRVLAARRGVSMEQHARDILERAVLGPAHDAPFAERIQQLFAGASIDALPIPPRRLPRALAEPGAPRANVSATSKAIKSRAAR